MTALVNIFGQLIHENWKLECKDADWFVRENSKTENPELRISGASALGFSLDKGDGSDPWPFLAALPGMRKVCDAILVTQIEDVSYVIAVEMKSGNTGKAPKQIASTWHFTEWLRELLKLNGHWDCDWKFCGLISSTPRRQEKKGTSRRRLKMTVNESSKGYRVAHICNERRLNLWDFHREMTAINT
ncbi:MAG: hypothetical protein H6R13_645 [Proteobacteria bacterium]|nr:hypothetical protein [Pseudomonadota bacterium]